MKYSTRAEILEKNPFLKRHWLSRVLAGSIISGASMSESDWKKIRFGFIGGVLLIFVFGINLFFDVDASTGTRALTAFLLFFFILGVFLTGSGCYGYINRDKIDATGAFKIDTRSIWPVAWLCAGITGGGSILAKLLGAW